jgi:hypothetical protein
MPVLAQVPASEMDWAKERERELVGRFARSPPKKGAAGRAAQQPGSPAETPAGSEGDDEAGDEADDEGGALSPCVVFCSLVRVLMNSCVHRQTHEQPWKLCALGLEVYALAERLCSYLSASHAGLQHAST